MTVTEHDSEWVQEQDEWETDPEWMLVPPRHTRLWAWVRRDLARLRFWR